MQRRLRDGRGIGAGDAAIHPSASATPTVRAHAVAPQIMSGETALYSVGSKAYGPHTWDSLTTHLVYQSDGNFVLYCNNGKVLWATNHYGGGWVSPPAYLIFQINGDLEIHGSGVWTTGTADHGGDYAVVQNDGNFVIYASGGGYGNGAI